MQKSIKDASLLDALVPIILLIVFLYTSVYLFGDNSSYGPNQIVLLICAGIAAIIGLKNGYQWQDIEQGIVKGISMSLSAMLILLAVGALIGTWMLAGTVPTLIYYGLALLDPAFFYPATCLICAVVAMSIGSSWTTAATVGVALMGVALGMQMDAVITAGAVVSGAYFGDKISPLSETTNLAPAVAGTELFSHIRYMLLTTIPSFIITLIIFTLISLNTDTQATDDRIAQMQSLLNNEFSIGLLQLVPLFILLGLALKKMPAFPAVFIGGLLGGMWAWLFQAEVVISMAPQGQSGFTANLMVVWQALFDGVSFSTPDDNLNDLLSRGGMSNMLDTVWLIICAMTFGAVLEKVGLLKKGVSLIMQGARSVGSTVSRTMLTCLGANILTADQYISIVMPGRMFKQEFSKRGLHQLNLSRSLEDGGTLTSPLIPWNTCGAYMHSVLMINPFDYIFYAFFNLINPVLSAIYAYLGINILRIAPENPQQVDVEVSRA